MSTGNSQSLSDATRNDRVGCMSLPRGVGRHTGPMDLPTGIHRRAIIGEDSQNLGGPTARRQRGECVGVRIGNERMLAQSSAS
jgi:hypothetical protein